MKAIRAHAFGGPEVLQLDEVPSLSPSPSEILIEIKAAGINPVDTYILSGNYSFKPALPYIPGMDAAGVVTQVGKGVKNYQKGDRVYISGNSLGTYAEQVVCSVDHLAALPDNVSFEQGAALGVPYATAYRALFTKGKAVANETVLIHGASGGVGVAAIQLAKMAGLKILATAGSSFGEQLLRQQGVEYIFDHSKSGYLQEIVAATQGRGPDLIIEMLANVNLDEDLKILAAQGRVVVVGSRGPVSINPRDLMGKESLVTGMALLGVPQVERQHIYEALDSGLRKGQLVPVIRKRYHLAQAGDALKTMMQKGATGKIVLIP